MTGNETCPAVFHDELSRDDHTYGCTLTLDHTGPHRNKRAGITWGGPRDWFGDDAA